jgi:hypothetical protein
VKWLFASAGSPLPEEGIEVLNMRTDSAAAIAGAIAAVAEVRDP